MLYQHPGVYIEHVPSNALAIEAASTSVTAIIGHVRRGIRVTAAAIPPLPETRKPVFVTSVGQYAAAFGPLGGGPGGIKNDVAVADAVGHAVNLYFANGGTKAYIVPVASTEGTAATAGTPLIPAVVAPLPPAAAIPAQVGIEFAALAGNRRLNLTATSPGLWANGLMARLEQGGLPGEYKLTLGLQKLPVPGGVLQSATFETVLEVITGLSEDPASSNFFTPRIAQNSTLVTAAQTNGGAASVLPRNALITGGLDPAAPGVADYTTAFERLKDYRDISIILLPGQLFLTATNAATIYNNALTHAEFMQNRLVVVDVDPGVKLISPADVQAAAFPTSTYAALYHPSLTVANPYYDADTAALLPKTFVVGPAAAAAGLWARIDGTRGVWKSPAGLEATVRGALGPTILIGNELQDNLNEFGVNCLRSIIGPTVVWGARTLATKAKPMFRYVAVRRTQSMIGESLYRALQAVVFEPNDHKLWASLRASVNDFMDGLHRAGAFQGEKASDAYFVRCGLGSTMTQGDIDGGIVRVVVGFAPLKPAEFVVVEIQQKVGQAS